MWNVAALFAGRHLISWLFEVLPVALLLLQSTGALTSPHERGKK